MATKPLGTFAHGAPQPITRRGAAVPSWLTPAARLADAAFETDLHGNFTAFGDARFLGFQARPLLGTAIESLFGLSGCLAAIITGLPVSGGQWQGQLRLRHAVGPPRLYRLTLAFRAGRFLAQATVTGLLIDLEVALESLPDAGQHSVIASPLCQATKLWLLASFTEQIARRFDRLDVEDRPGTLILLGFGSAEAALHTPIAISIAAELSEIIRPTDLLGRIAPAIVALWCDGMDYLTGAERATRLCKYLPTALPGQSLLSLGLATRWPGSAEDPETLLARAIAALQRAQAQTVRDNAASWFVNQAHDKP
ncbi:MAG: hypothetical protein POG74_06845 [Acidocella sp.]|nr:hypothetical protein [Acidocella sp.]